MDPKGSKYVQKISGPNTDPCGTPNAKWQNSDMTPFTDTHCDRPLKYVRNKLSTDPVSPILFSKNDKRRS